MKNLNTELLFAEINKEICTTDFLLKHPVYPSGRPMNDTEISIMFGYNMAFHYLRTFLKDAV